MKLLFITVGVGKDGDIASGIEASIQNQRPDKVIFICTKESKEKVVETFLMGRDEIKRCETETFTLRDENNARRVYQDCKEIIDRFLIRHPRSQHDYVADFTTGTKAMSVGLSLAAVAREFQHLSYVAGERGEAGRVIPGTEEPRSFIPLDVYRDRDIRRAVDLFNAHQFQAAIEIVFPLQAAYREEKFQKSIRFLTDFIRAFQEWDRFKPQVAFDRFNKLGEEKNGDEFFVTLQMKAKIESFKQALHQVIQDDFSEARAVDLFQNACRRIEENKYDDAVARFYRLVEFLAQQFLKNKYGIDTADVNAEKVPEAMRSLLPDPVRGKVQISMEKSYQMLRAAGEPLGELQARDEMKRLLLKRNHSILAHGFSPVSKEDAVAFKEMLQPYLKAFVPNFEQLEKSCAFPKLETRNVEQLLDPEADFARR